MIPSGQKLPASHLQSLLDSATNAADKGAQQFFVRPDYAGALTVPLADPPPTHFADRRLVVADLTGCGNGALLDAARRAWKPNVDTYGMDLDPRLTEGTGHHHRLLCGDITRHVELLQVVGFRATYTLANPPYSLNWHADRLAPVLEKSDDLRVRDTWRDLVTTPGKSTVDSTLATFLLSLHFQQSCGEGFLVTLWSTYERLIQPTAANDHTWLTVRIPKGGRMFDPLVGDYDIAVIYYARDHRLGDPHHVETESAPSAEALYHRLDGCQPRRQRTGIQPRHDLLAKQQADRWRAAAGEYQDRHDATVPPEWNLFLRRDGRIGTHLTPFQKTAGYLPSDAVRQLHEIDGDTPMALTVQRASRDALLRAVHNTELWRVQPELVAAVEQAVADYQAQRAPLYPLAPVQRLGYLDEEDRIECRVDGLGPFQAGHRYPIETHTEEVSFETEIFDASGETNIVERTGRELVLKVWSAAKKTPDTEHRFIMGGKYQYEHTGTIDGRDHVHTFADLVDHFHIPEVPDVAAANPEQYQKNLGAIAEIEELINTTLATA